MLFAKINADASFTTHASLVASTQTGPPGKWARHLGKGAHFSSAGGRPESARNTHDANDEKFMRYKMGECAFHTRICTTF